MITTFEIIQEFFNFLILIKTSVFDHELSEV